MKFCVPRPAAVGTIVPEINQNSAPKVAGLENRDLIVGGVNVGGGKKPRKQSEQSPA